MWGRGRVGSVPGKQAVKLADKRIASTVKGSEEVEKVVPAL